jgi:hypothetical protein
MRSTIGYIFGSCDATSACPVNNIQGEAPNALRTNPEQQAESLGSSNLPRRGAIKNAGANKIVAPTAITIALSAFPVAFFASTRTPVLAASPIEPDTVRLMGVLTKTPNMREIVLVMYSQHESGFLRG